MLCKDSGVDRDLPQISVVSQYKGCMFIMWGPMEQGKGKVHGGRVNQHLSRGSVQKCDRKLCAVVSSLSLRVSK